MHPFREKFLLGRRRFLTSAAAGIGGVALEALLQEDRARASGRAAVRALAPKAKNCIFFFQEGGPSQFDLFSYKPTLNRLGGQRPPENLLQGKRFAFIDKNTAVLLATDPQRTFAPRGQSGMILSELLPNISRHADRICLLNAVFTNQFNHTPAQLVMQTGNNLDGHPSMGSWFVYGLGSENHNLPGYVVMNSAVSLGGGATLWDSGFLPSSFGGVLFQPAGNAILHLAPPAGLPSSIERRGLDALGRLNEIRRLKVHDPEIAARVANFELAFRMQSEAPDLTDLSKESPATLERYGVNREDPPAEQVNSARRPPAGAYKAFARHCLLARRMVEKGVRFVNVFSGSWDAHQHVSAEVPFLAGLVDQPIAALIQDLADRGLLDETLVVFAGEFGRTPLAENVPGPGINTGRDHHPDAFSIFMVGGGVRGGLTYGETDEIGWSPVKDGVDVCDLHATILHLFGVDHNALTYRYQGVDQRLTPLTRPARVVDAILA